MTKLFLKITFIATFIISLISCNSHIDQSSMFKGRSHKSKKNGVYDAGLNTKKPISVQTAHDIDKLSKYDTNPKKAGKKEAKALAKKKRKAQKARDKYNKKRHVKVKTTKGKTGGEK